MEKRNRVFGVVALVWVMLAGFPAASDAYVEKVFVDGDRYFTSGRIDNNFSYNDLDIQSADGACVFRGTLTNDSRVLQAVDVTVRAVDASEKPLWRHVFSIPALSAGDSYQFEERVDDCPDAVPYRLKFEISQ